MTNNNTMGIYVHIPFCVQKCKYCDFLSAPCDKDTRKEYVESLIREILACKKTVNKVVNTIYLGGGTPSILDGKNIKRIINTIKDNYTVAIGAEITIECNPGTLNTEKIEFYKKVGINRISIGLQSTNNEELKRIGRIHTFETFLESYNMLRNAGFSNINVDLMSGLPYQSLKDYESNVKKIIELNPEHISSYSLIVEEGTVLSDELKGNEDALPDEDTEREMYYLTNRLLEKAGYTRYEISNYSKNGYESRHNSSYWNRTNYLGIGLGASSLIDGVRFKNTDDLKKYLVNSGNVSLIREDIQELSIEERMSEFMFLGLRMINGISKKEFEAEFNRKYESIFGDITDKFVKMNLLIDTGECVRLTNKGIDVCNSIMCEFLL